MIEIKYEGNCELSNVSGHSIAEVRKTYQSAFGISEKTVAVLNDKKIGSAAEISTILMDDDRLVFKAAKGRKTWLMVGALLLAMAVTGGVFASSYTNAATTINAGLANTDFALVTPNISNIPSWTAHGLQKNSTGSGTLFDIDTQTSDYTGDFVATVSLTNTDALIIVYRSLVLSIEVRDSSGNLIDINSDNVSNGRDYALLTLDNSQVLLNIKQAAPDVYTVKQKSGYYICNVVTAAWLTTDAAPQLFCEVAQR